MAIWFTVRLADRPGSLAALAGALGDEGVNITGIVGVAEDTGGTLMLTSSDPHRTSAILERLGIAYEQHDSTAETGSESLRSVRRGLADRGLDVEGEASPRH